MRHDFCWLEGAKEASPTRILAQAASPASVCAQPLPRVDAATRCAAAASSSGCALLRQGGPSGGRPQRSAVAYLVSATGSGGGADPVVGLSVRPAGAQRMMCTRILSYLGELHFERN